MRRALRNSSLPERAVTERLFIILLLAAMAAFVTSVWRLHHWARSWGEKFHEEFFMCFGRAGCHCVCNSVNRKRKRGKANGQADGAPPPPPSSPPSPSPHGQEEVIRKWPLDRGHFFFVAPQNGEAAKPGGCTTSEVA
jgi:hypothetical protein